MTIGDELLRALQGANVTINVHHGTGDIHSQSGHQIHYHAAPAKEAKRIEQYTYRCQSCGYTSHERDEFIGQGSYGNRSYLCRECENDRQRIKQEVIAEPTITPQITAPEPAELVVIDAPRRSYLESVYNDPRYEQAEQLRSSSLKQYRDTEFSRVNQALTDWRGRHPLLRAVEPLPPEMHTHGDDAVMTNYEARQQAEWDRLYGD